MESIKAKLQHPAVLTFGGLSVIINTCWWLYIGPPAGSRFDLIFSHYILAVIWIIASVPTVCIGIIEWQKLRKQKTLQLVKS